MNGLRSHSHVHRVRTVQCSPVRPALVTDLIIISWGCALARSLAFTTSVVALSFVVKEERAKENNNIDLQNALEPVVE